MNKPEFLKGEVKEFIDCYTDAMRQSVTREDFIDIYALYSRFYRQHFKQEMITEYFEGWEETPVKNGYIDRNQWQSIYGFYQGAYNEYRPTALQANTLSQFITNCIQAGIKLTWKEK